MFVVVSKNYTFHQRTVKWCVLNSRFLASQSFFLELSHISSSARASPNNEKKVEISFLSINRTKNVKSIMYTVKNQNSTLSTIEIYIFCVYETDEILMGWGDVCVERQSDEMRPKRGKTNRNEERKKSESCRAMELWVVLTRVFPNVCECTKLQNERIFTLPRAFFLLLPPRRERRDFLELWTHSPKWSEVQKSFSRYDEIYAMTH